ncbi:MAG: transglutaminase-like domain-containing protein [Akkermansiaceae bacterium]
MRSGLLLLAMTAGYALLWGWPEQWHTIVRICVAVSLLVVAFCFWGHSEKPISTPAKSARKPRLLDYLTVGIAVLLVECFFLIFLSIAPEKSEELAITLDEALQPDLKDNEEEAKVENNDESGEANGGSESLVTSNWLFSGPGPRSLNKNKKVRPSNRPEVYLFPSTPDDAQILLTSERFIRNFTLATYRDESWLPHSMVPKTLQAQGVTITRSVTTPGPKVTYEISHQVNRGGQTLAITVPNFISIKQPSLRETSPDTFRLPPNTAREKDYRYEVTSVPFDFQSAIKVVPGESPSPEYLELPTNPKLRGKIQTLAAEFGTPSRESLLTLRQYLQENYQYSLELSMPANAEPVDSFLFETRTGYCTHFATATVLIARAMGVPARIAFGWSGGRYFSGPNLFVFRAKEAHAWAEIFLEDRGWVIFETTPSTREEGSPSLAGTNEASPFPEDLDNEDTTIPEQDTAPLLTASLWIGATAFTLLLTALLIKRPTTQINEQNPAPGVLPDPPNYLSAFRRACQVHGNPMPPGRTLRAHLEKNQTPDFTADLLQYHYAVQYGDQPRNKATEKILLGQLRNWEKEGKEFR